MLMPPKGFRYTKGAPRQFKRSDLEAAVTREFCATCGTHIATQRSGLPAVILKIGTLDDVRALAPWGHLIDPARFRAALRPPQEAANRPGLSTEKTCETGAA